jgi:hypothetical protein
VEIGPVLLLMEQVLQDAYMYGGRHQHVCRKRRMSKLSCSICAVAALMRLGVGDHYIAKLCEKQTAMAT